MLNRIRGQAQQWLTEAAGGPPDDQQHRAAMRQVKAAVAVLRDPGGPCAPGPRQAALQLAQRGVARLEELQAECGLFAGGDNLLSPPDTSFTIADLGLTLAVLAARPAPGDPGTGDPGTGDPGPGDPGPGDAVEADVSAVGDRLRAVLVRALPALVAGGLHTPNHRWELSAALTRAAALLGEQPAADRVEQWLAEGVDLDADGLYSERSPNYAAHVSAPSLIVLGRRPGRHHLHEGVHAGLHAQLDLTDPAGRVETVHSRRQDQKGPAFPLGPFLGPLLWAGHELGCARCAGAARIALDAPGVDAPDVLARWLAGELPGLAGPAVAEDADPLGPRPDPAPPSADGRASAWFGSARLLRRTWPEGTDVTVYAGSDVPAAGRVGSGLACNPTFLRALFCGAGVRSVRLSRNFFGMGPFRATRLTGPDADPLVLTEEVVTGYYQPLAAQHRDPGGRYPLEHDGRFSAGMAFSRRRRDDCRLATAVRVSPAPGRVELEISTQGPATEHVLELALTPGLRPEQGAVPLGQDRYRLAGRRAVCLGPGGGLLVRTSAPAEAGIAAGYDPGEAYTFVGGSDALAGERLYLTWRSPGTVRVWLTPLPHGEPDDGQPDVGQPDDGQPDVG